MKVKIAAYTCKGCGRFKYEYNVNEAGVMRSMNVYCRAGFIAPEDITPDTPACENFVREHRVINNKTSGVERVVVEWENP